MAAPTGRKKARSRRTIPAIGEARQSQVLQLYGPGAMVDLPGYAVVIGGCIFGGQVFPHHAVGFRFTKIPVLNTHLVGV